MILEINADRSPILHALASAVLMLHIASGSIALIAGTVAAIARKGSRVHRSIGNVFIVAMLIMAIIGAAVSPFLSPPRWVNVVAGFFTIYLVITAWLTLQPNQRERSVQIAILISSVALCLATLVIAINSSRADAPPAFIFGAIAGLAAVGDCRLLIGKALSGVQRLARHLWRMCYALWIAVGSLFLGQPQVFPDAVRESGALFVPVIAVLLLMIYWLVRVRRSPRVVLNDRQVSTLREST